MKPRAVVLAAVAANGASAQVGYGGGAVTTTTTTSASSSSSLSAMSSVSVAPVTASPSASASYVTVTYDDCPSSSVATMITVTNGVTVTYCPECQMSASASTASPVVPHTTVYTTTYMSLCPTGLVPATYTITESCTDATPTWGATSSGYIPPDFTVTTKQCTVCDKTPVPVTITEPCTCKASMGTPISQPMATATGSSPSGGSGSGSPPSGGSGSGSPPSGGSGSGSPPSGSVISQISDGQIQAPATSAAPGGSASSGGAAPYPTTTATETVCPGPQCRAVASGAPSGVTYGNTTGITPYAGGAAASHVGIFTASLAAVVAALAFAL